MKLLLCLLFTGCASTTIYENGKLAMKTQADGEGITYRSPAGSYFHADKLNHSTPTLAQGKAASDKIGAVGGAVAASGIMAIIK